MSLAGDLWRTLRPHQWIKNAFVFMGLLFGHAWHRPMLLAQVAAAAAAFCLVSSAVYVVNDLIDREADRLHPQKRHRPIAAGRLGTGAASVLALAVGLGGLALGAWGGLWVLVILAAYVVLNTAYSMGLKHVVILDVFAIAAGFMLRILAGTVGVGIPPSRWLLLCGLMVTLFLGFAKRRAEIGAIAANDHGAHRRVLEHYTPVLLDKFIGITATSVILSYSLYTMSPDTVRIHGTTNLIYTVPFIVYGIFRYVYRLHRGGGGGDPAHDLLHDPHLMLAVAGWLALSLWLLA